MAGSRPATRASVESGIPLIIAGAVFGYAAHTDPATLAREGAIPFDDMTRLADLLGVRDSTYEGV